MGSGAERDVIIKLKLVADSSSQATAKVVAGQAESVVTAGSNALDSLQALAAATYENISEAHKINSAQQVRIDKIDSATRLGMMEDLISRQIGLEEKETAGLNSEEVKRDKINKAAAKKAEKEAKETANKLKAAQKAQVAGRQKANESAVVMIQGLADITEGAAKIGLVSEENFEKFAKNFIMIQEGIRVFKGFTDVIWKSREGLVALGTATKAQATANEILAASNTKVTASTGAAGAAGAAGTVAGSSAVATGAKVSADGAGVAFIAGAKALSLMALAAAKLAAIGIVLAEGLLGITRAFEWVIGASWNWNESIVMAGDSYLSASENAEKATKKLEAAEKRKQKQLDARSKFEDEEAKRVAFSRDLHTANDAVSDARLSGGISDVDKERTAALRNVQRAEKAVTEEKKIQEERIAAGHFDSLKNRVRVTADLEKAQERLLTAEQSRLKSIMDQKKLIGEQIKAEKEKIQLAKDAMKSEQQRIRETFGKLTAPEQERAKDISQKKARGEQLSRRDVQDLERFGLAGDHASNFYANAGRQAGADSFASGLNLIKKPKSYTEAEDKLSDLERQELARSAREDQARASVIAKAEARARTTQARVAQSAEEQNIEHEDLSGYRKPADIGKAAQQAAADGSDEVEKASMEVVGALGDTFGSMMKSLEDMKKEVDKNKILEKAYRQ